MSSRSGAGDNVEAMRVDGFKRVYEQCFPSVWSYAVSRVGRQAAEDVVSETFAVAWRRRANIPDDALPWLIRVARNVAFDLSRRDARQRLLDAALRDSAARSPVAEPDVAESVVARDQALTALASLSENDRELLILVAWQGLSARRVALVLGCSRPTFFVRLHRARSRLERALRQQTMTSEAAPAPSVLVMQHKEMPR